MTVSDNKTETEHAMIDDANGLTMIIIIIMLLCLDKDVMVNTNMLGINESKASS